MVFLDFEAPISELYDQLEKLKAISLKGKVDVSNSIAELEVRIKRLVKKFMPASTVGSVCRYQGTLSGLIRCTTLMHLPPNFKNYTAIGTLPMIKPL